MAKYCLRCGGKNTNMASVCDHCGAPLGGGSIEEDNSGQESAKNDNLLVLSPKLFDFTKLIHNTVLTDEKLITEISCQNDFIYILNEGADFISTEYKVLNSMGNKGLLKCKLLKYNGKDAIYYMVGKLKSLEVMLASFDSMRFLYVVENILNQVSDIKRNGFLTDTGIDIRIERIYVDVDDGQVYLTYVPVKRRSYQDVIYLENDLRQNLAYMIRALFNLENGKINDIVQMLEEPGCSFSNILSAIRQSRLALS